MTASAKSRPNTRIAHGRKVNIEKAASGVSAVKSWREQETRYSQVYDVDAQGVFRYYQYTDLSSPERFQEYVEQVKSAALYDTGVTAEYGDQLLTLSTCNYHTGDGRFVVVARKQAQDGEVH